MNANKGRVVVRTLFAGMIISGCNSTPLDMAAKTGCSESLSGAVTATYGCPVAASSWTSGSNRGTVSIAATDSSALSVSIPFVGEPQLGTYTLSSQGTVIGGISLKQGVWFAGVAFPPSGNLSIVGGYTLTLTSVSVLTTTGTGKTYAVHGSLDANLVETSINPGWNTPLALHAVF